MNYYLDNGNNKAFYSNFEAALNDAQNVLWLAKQHDLEKPEVKIVRINDGFECWNSNHDPNLLKYEEFSKEAWSEMSSLIHTESAKPTIYFDIDGTLGKWYSDMRGFTYEEMFEPNNHYFRNIEPNFMTIEVAKRLCDMGYDVAVLSAADRDTISDKYEWVKEHLPFVDTENIFFCPLGVDKSNFVKGNADKSILIDDYPANLQKWDGTAVKCINGVNSQQMIYPEIYCDIERETTPTGYTSRVEENIIKAVDLITKLYDLQEKNISKENNKDR